MSQGASKYAVANGLRLHYVEWGEATKPPVVALHGLRACGHWFDEFADVAEPHYRLIVSPAWPRRIGLGEGWRCTKPTPMWRTSPP